MLQDVLRPPQPLRALVLGGVIFALGVGSAMPAEAIGAGTIRAGAAQAGAAQAGAAQAGAAQAGAAQAGAAQAGAAQAGAAQGGAVAGTVSAVEGGPIAGAQVLIDGARGPRSRLTDARGAYAIFDVAPGSHPLGVTALGYEPVGERTIDVVAGRTTIVDIQLVRSPGSLTTIGHVLTRAGEALSTSSAPTQELDAQAFAAAGSASVADALAQEALSAAVIRPAGANPAAPAAVALRGPDPTETLFDIDGHALNSGGSGALDLSLIDPAQLSAVQLVYGIAPSSLVGPNTIDGAINMRTLQPTSAAHGLARFSAGSFASFGETLQATGTDGAVGYALSAHRQTTRGETNQAIAVGDGSTPSVGSAVLGDTAIANVRVGLGTSGASTSFSLRDQSAFRDLSAALSAQLPDGGSGSTFDDFSGSAQLTHGIGVGVNLELPLGAHAGNAPPATLTLRHLTAVTDDSVFGPGAGTNPYLLNDRDAIDDDILEFDRALPGGSLAAKVDLRGERLTTQVTSGGGGDQSWFRSPFVLVSGGGASVQAVPVPPSSVDLGQTERSAAVRYARDASARWHYAVAVYYSDFSSFGTSLDPRIGVVFTPSAFTAVRASVGSTFQSPQLPELYVPLVLPPRDPQGFFDIGNPGLRADRATNYDLGLERIVPGAAQTRLDIDVYQSDVRDPAQRFIPAADCLAQPPPPVKACESFPINVGGAVYRGIEARMARAVGRLTRLVASYVVNSAYPTSVSPRFQNGSIVAGEQFAGVPLQSASLGVERATGGAFAYEASMHYEGRYNELNRPPFATVRAGVTWSRGHLEAGLYGTNVTDVYDDRFTLAQGGVPYGGAGGPIATDALSLQGRALTLVITTRY